MVATIAGKTGVMKTTGDDRSTADVVAEFESVVNMTAGQLERWLETDESKSVGWSDAQGHESVGHHSGRKIAQILRTKKADYSDADRAHMRKVVGFVHRHLAQRPAGDVVGTRWAASLKNWGHDPTK